MGGKRKALKDGWSPHSSKVSLWALVKSCVVWLIMVLWEWNCGGWHVEHISQGVVMCVDPLWSSCVWMCVRNTLTILFNFGTCFVHGTVMNFVFRYLFAWTNQALYLFTCSNYESWFPWSMHSDQSLITCATENISLQGFSLANSKMILSSIQCLFAYCCHNFKLPSILVVLVVSKLWCLPSTLHWCRNIFVFGDLHLLLSLVIDYFDHGCHYKDYLNLIVRTNVYVMGILAALTTITVRNQAHFNNQALVLGFDLSY